MIFPPKDFILPFVKKVQLSKHTYSFFFDKRNISFDYLPGQYIKMFLDIATPDEKGSSRSFSVVNSPLDKEYLAVTTNLSESAFKRTLTSLVEGQQVRFFGPAGRFILDENDPSQKVFLAGGIGITPFHCMVQYAYQKKLQQSISLFVSFSSPEEMIYYDELTKVNAEMPNIKIIYTITHEETIMMPWNGEKGRTSKEMLARHGITGQESFFLCGPPAMVIAMEELVVGMGVPKEQVKKEQFTGY